ncbi:MAG: alpha/beta hydrolase [Anaerolineae bacterium]|nr:alpha/beta hydrolase [Anaerolineae bacterium]
MVCLLLLAVTAAAARPDYHYAVTPCPFYPAVPGEEEGVTFACGTLTVPEQRADPASPPVELAVAIIYSTAARPAPDPVLYLEGGPGGSALAAYDTWFTSGLRADRDIILIDQRGTGYSWPSLNCPEFDDPATAATAATRACRQRLVAEGIDLSAYTSAASAQDIGDLIAALNLEQVNLFGVSYGTRLALTVLRDRPERLRSLILDAVYPPQVAGLEEQAYLGNAAFQRLFAACAAAAACQAAYPDLEQRFYATVDALNASPLTDPDDDSFWLSGDDLVNEIFNLLYDTASLPLLPALMEAAARRDVATYLALLYPADETGATADGWLDLDSLSDDDYFAAWADYLGFASVPALEDYLSTLTDAEYDAAEADFQIMVGGSNGVFVDSDAEGLYNSVECHDDVPFNRPEMAAIRAAAAPPQIRQALLDGIAGAFADCALWDVPPGAPLENAPVTADLPVLLLSGEFDPITPAAWAQQAAATLPNSQHIILPGMGHGTVDFHPCPTALARQFLAAPAAPLAADCVAQMRPPDFIILPGA